MEKTCLVVGDIMMGLFLVGVINMKVQSKHFCMMFLLTMVTKVMLLQPVR